MRQRLYAGLLVCAMLLAIPATSSAQDGPLKVALTALIASDGADLGMTMYAAGVGGVEERNRILRPLWDQPVAFGATKMGIAAVKSLTVVKLYQSGRRKTAVGMAAVFVGVNLLVINHNARVIREARR